MKRTPFLAILGVVALGAMPALSAAPALAQSGTSGPNGTSMTNKANTDNATTSKVTADHQLRTSKIIGASVYDDHNNSIGTVDDILLSPNEHAANAVLSVGGFLGIGNKLVEVPYSRLKINNEGHVVLPDASKDRLKSMTEYHYNAG